MAKKEQAPASSERVVVAEEHDSNGKLRYRESITTHGKTTVRIRERWVDDPQREEQAREFLEAFHLRMIERKLRILRERPEEVV